MTLKLTGSPVRGPALLLPMGDHPHWRYDADTNIPEAYAALKLELRDPGLRKLRIWQMGLQKESARLARLFSDPSDFILALSILLKDAAVNGREEACEWWKMNCDDTTVKQTFLPKMIGETLGLTRPEPCLFYMDNEALEEELRQVKAPRAQAQAGPVHLQPAGAPGALVSWVISAGTCTTSPFHSTRRVVGTTRSIKLHTE